MKYMYDSPRINIPKRKSLKLLKMISEKLRKPKMSKMDIRHNLK